MNHSLLRIPSRGTINEPELHPAVQKGFLFVPTAGMRLAPEVLLLEMFREVFFREFSGSANEVQLAPDSEQAESNKVFTPREQAVLYSLRGRKKATRQSRISDFYAPAYPCLARHGWLRRRSDRVVRDFLLSGALAQYFQGAGKDRNLELNQSSELIVRALIGHNSASCEHVHGKEILSVPIRNIEFDINEEDSIERIKQKVNQTKRIFRTSGGKDDNLASVIYQDLLEICNLESQLPRIQWLLILMSFLRIAIPAYLLAHMKLTVYLRDWIMEALEEEKIQAEKNIIELILKRNLGLFHPTCTPTREVFQHVENYMKARVELSIFLYRLDKVTSNILENKEIVTTNIGADKITINQLLTIFRDNKENFCRDYSGLTPRQIATREGEEWLAWRNPIKKGQGKNYDEFLRVLYKDFEGDEGGSYVLEPRGRGADRGFIVFPGPLLITTFVILADRAKERREGIHRKGKLMLSDVEAQFNKYGIDFSSAAGARPRLIEVLKGIGLLKGSPDAGESVEIVCPY